MKCSLLLLVGVVILLGACAPGFTNGCTKEIKACPGGGGVSRVPPACEFAPCPPSSCDYTSDPTLHYVGTSREECSVIRFSCAPETEYFSNTCGCGCKEIEPVACTLDAKICPDGTAVGRIPPDCSFASCPSITHTCSANERLSGGCDAVYDPVCGYFDPAKIQCVKAPCGQTYSNGCQACHDAKVKFWESGECPN